MLTKEQLNEDLITGYTHLRVDYYKASGKWYAGGLVKIPSNRIPLDRYILNVIDIYQEIIVKGAYKEFYVIISEHHYDDIFTYIRFCTRLYKPEEGL